MTESNQADGAALVRAELEAGLPELATTDFTVDCELAQGSSQAVAWTYVAALRPDRDFLGVRLTGPLTLRGVTLIRRSNGDGASDRDGLQLRWYIDWLDALNRAGLNAALRPVPADINPI
jgi:hypothetical protein